MATTINMDSRSTAASAALSDVIADVECQAWALHRRLGEAYRSKGEQYDDMIKLGKLGRELRRLQEARAIVIDVARRAPAKEAG